MLKEFVDKDGHDAVKFLLFAGYQGRPNKPAVMLFFHPPFWDLKVCVCACMHVCVYYVGVCMHACMHQYSEQVIPSFFYFICTFFLCPGLPRSTISG